MSESSLHTSTSNGHWQPELGAKITPKRVALYGKQMAAKKFQYVVQVVEVLLRLGIDIVVESEFVAQFGETSTLQSLPRFVGKPDQIDMAISVGGDGTFLNTAAKLGHDQVPILGINIGRLGFLADIMPEHIETALQQVMNGDYELSLRSLIEVKAEDEIISVYPFALNEIAVLKHDNSSLIEVQTYVDGELLTNYLADGLIVSTPTGSTGYSLSVGGPVLAPESPTFCVAPVAPHTLTVRPVILSDKCQLSLRVKSRTGRYLISVDGRSQSAPAGGVLTLKKADYKVSVVKIKGNDFFHTLRDKMMWGMDQRNQ